MEQLFGALREVFPSRLTSERPLTGAILGAATIGRFFAVFPLNFRVDIDDYAGKGGGCFLSVYDAVCRKFARPSILCRTTRGLTPFIFSRAPRRNSF
ncbi:MAG: hypothetical protein LBD58_09985 [Treponema sp.]|jgi:hypothetical protein|nr:hypothetical protein [Treponema sp.]